jgi:hypothetical protein
MQPAVGRHQFSRPEQYTAFVDALTANLRSLPNVQSAAGVLLTPKSWPFSLETMPSRPVAEMPRAEFGELTRDGFRTFGVHLAQGREFTDRDTFTPPRVAIINATMAKMYFAHGNPIGQHLSLPSNPPSAPFEIVGVVSDFHPMRATRSCSRRSSSCWSLPGRWLRCCPRAGPPA